MQKLEVERSFANKVYRSTDPPGKKVLENLFGDIFNNDITEIVKTFEDACGILGIDPDDVFNASDSEDEIAYKKLKIIAKALNEDWLPDWNNSNQRKWAPWFYLNNPGFRFDDSDYGITGADASGGSRLCFATEELATYAAKQFLSLYENFLK